METFLTTNCLEIEEAGEIITTCDYGGVLFYSLIFLFLTGLFSISLYLTYKLLKKVL